MKKEGLFLLGMVLIILGVSIGTSRLVKIVRCTEETTATIVNVTDKDPSSAKKTGKYYPTVKFTAGDETIRETVDAGTKDAGKYKVSETLTVKYDPGKPEIFILQGSENSTRLLSAAAFIVIGIVMVIVGIGIARRSEGVPVFRA